jgi:hypothetical protein
MGRKIADQSTLMLCECVQTEALMRVFLARTCNAVKRVHQMSVRP